MPSIRIKQVSEKHVSANANRPHYKDEPYQAPIGTFEFLNFSGLAVLRLFDEPPVSHFGYTGGLTVDRPTRPMIVRRAVLRALIDMGENAETEVGVLVKDSPLSGPIGTDILRYEAWIRTSAFRVFADQLATGGAGILQQRLCGNRSRIDQAYMSRLGLSFWCESFWPIIL